MNRVSIDYTIEQLIESGVALATEDISTRIRQEIMGLERLRHKDDYLGLYDEVIRYMFVLCLMKGYDIMHYRVHQALKIFLNNYLSISIDDVSNIANARHTCKYYGLHPSLRIRMVLSSGYRSLLLNHNIMILNISTIRDI